CDRQNRSWFIVAIKEHFDNIPWNIFYLCRECNLLALQYGFDFLKDPYIAVLAKRQNTTTADAQLFIRDHRLFRNFFNNTKTVARRACTVDRKSTRLNSSHVKISYAVFCLKKKKYKNN